MVERALDWESGGPDSSPGVAATSLFDPVYIIGPHLCWVPHPYYKSFPPESCFHCARTVNLERLSVGVKGYTIGMEIERELQRVSFLHKY